MPYIEALRVIYARTNQIDICQRLKALPGTWTMNDARYTILGVKIYYDYQRYMSLVSRLP